MAKKNASGPSPDSTEAPSHRGTAFKIDPRVVHLLRDLSNWLDTYQYQIVTQLVCREIRRQAIPLPPHHQKELEEMEAELGIDPEDRGKLRRPKEA